MVEFLKSNGLMTQKLPEQLEYRLISKTLIIRDVEADIIVDFVPNAIQ